MLTFVDFCNECSHEPLKCLIFDSKFTTYQNLSRLNDDDIKFITLRRRGSSLIQKAQRVPDCQWTTITIDDLKRKHSFRSSTFENHFKEYDLHLGHCVAPGPA